MSDMVEMRQPDGEREAPQDNRRQPGISRPLRDGTPSGAGDDGMV
ncbi:MAG: hypothetical protein ACREGK_11675 [Geminicoccales bacterium]